MSHNECVKEVKDATTMLSLNIERCVRFTQYDESGTVKMGKFQNDGTYGRYVFVWMNVCLWCGLDIHDKIVTLSHFHHIKYKQSAIAAGST